jgi:enediyne biosynthesis protein E4
MWQSRLGARTALFFTVRWWVFGSVAVAAAVATATVVALSPRDDPTPLVAMAPPHFVDETAISGINHTYDGDFPFAVGGGVAVLDCIGNGKPDLYLAGGANLSALYRNDTPQGGDLKFTQLPSSATDLRDVLGAYPIDVDGDGITDLVVLRRGASMLLRGLGDCTFAPGVPLETGMNWSTAFSATWEGANDAPTLALGHYLRLDASGQPDPAYRCSDNLLLRPDGPIDLMPGFCALSLLFSDWDRSGRRDLRVTNDRQYYVNGQDQLWRVANSEAPRLYTSDDGWVSLQVWGMGIASFDLTGRGYPDVFVTSQGDNKLQTLASGPANPTYRDIALKRGVTSAQPFTGGDVRPSTAWHPQFEDVNNDGFIDLFVSKGNVSAMAEYANRDPSDLFIGQPDGTFKEAADTAGITTFERGRGAALADFAMDGMLDLVEVNYGQPVRVWRNVGSGDASHPVAAGNWLGVRLREPGGNRDAIGAWIEVQLGKTIIRRELTIGGGHVSGQLGWTHFGLGRARDAQVRVQWPDGAIGPWQRLVANQFVIIDR